jgi:hypothetical protein
MDPRHARAYVERGWAIAETAKREHWAREFAERGPAATFEVSRALWRHMRLVDPAWPSEQEQLEDLAHHVALKRLIERAADVFARRAH